MLLFCFFSCVFCQGEEIFNQDDNIFPGVEITDLGSGENPSSGDENNIEEILRKLSAVLHNDLLQTISSIQEDMADMKNEVADMKDVKSTVKSQSARISSLTEELEQQETRTVNNMNTEVVDMKVKIVSNEGKIVQNSDTISDVHSTADVNSDQISSMSEELEQQKTVIESLTSSDRQQQTTIGDNIKRLDSQATRGSWCAYKGKWNTGGTVTYDKLTLSDSNMNITDTPLDIKTGNNSHT